ncbi:MAG TPA: peptidyl-prolyl cis-trans isomerase [Candidatus Sulfotelmatobacter sp.]|nr:peptidyl-prolyl cis-trans isomerase [Candidatus Sulfotelmatobacter sp.]
MRKSWLLCVLLGAMAWGQATPGTPPPAPAGVAPNGEAKPKDTSASVPADAVVITVNGVCPAPAKTATAAGTAAKPAATPAAKTPSADCKTTWTRAEFEKLAGSLVPNLTPQLRKQLANLLPQLIALSTQAKKKGLDKTTTYEENLKFAKMQILANELRRNIQEEAAKVPPADIAAYYKEHPEAFEQYNLDRLFVPRTKQLDTDAKDDDDDDKAEKLTEEQQKAKQAEEKAKTDAAEQAMSQLAESLRTRAAAGEDFVKLQKEAFEAGGMKIESPTVSLPKVRRAALPPGHAAVFDLKAGEVSQVINDSGGHYIYKLNSKDQPSLDQVKEEIHSTLQNQRTREMMDKVNGSYKVETNEAYFGPGAPGMAPQPRMPNPRMAPSPMAPAPQQQTPPPAAKPN